MASASARWWEKVARRKHPVLRKHRRTHAGLTAETWPVADWPNPPEKRFLLVTIDTVHPLGICNPPPPAEALRQRQALLNQLELEAQRGKGGRRNGP